MDSARVHVRAGRGGRGSTSFRHERFIPRGGPDGGDGGRGGSVILQASSELSTLAAAARRQDWSAEDGVPGAGGGKSGRDGADLRMRVPVGTVVTDVETAAVVADLDAPGAEVVVAKGGAGGRGNVHFRTSANQAPRVAEPGRRGEERELLLDLKLIADAGLVGPPNAGKSSLLGAISSARPRVGDYPFTTLAPELGVAEDAGGRRLVVADVPGLIEGASGGAGLGLRFLRHVERTRVLVYVIDAAAPEPWKALEAVRSELHAYSPGLLAMPSITAFNKIDLEAAQRFRSQNSRPDALFCSARTGEGIPELVEAVAAALRAAPALARPPLEARVTRLPTRGRRRGQPPVVTRRAWGFEVSGPRAEGLVEATDFDSPDSLERFQLLLDRIGVNSALEAAGAQPGDTVRMGRLEFEFQP